LDLKYERLTGTIVKYDMATAWGSVVSHLFPGEVNFRTERVMPEFQNHPFQDGEAIEFDVQAEDRGMAHAVMMKPMVGRTPHECLGQRHRGYVRRCAERWGFLNSAAFDGDLFVHRDNLLMVPDQMIEGQPPLRSGQAVEFDVALDDRGRAVARQITTHALPRPWDFIGHRLRGQVRSFQGAWGFIICDRFAGDLFVHRDSFLAQFQGTQISIGTLVEFDIERDQRRKGAKDRLVARRVAILGPGDPAAMAQVPQQQQIAGAMHQPSYADPYMTGALNPQAGYAQPNPMYYPQLQPDPYQAYNPYAQSPYVQQPLMQPQPAAAPMQQQVLAQQYGQVPYPGQYQVPVAGAPQVQPQLPQVPNAYLPAAEAVQPVAQMPQAPVAGAKPPAPAEAPGAPGASGDQQGLLHITMHDWEPDQPGQLWVTKGTLVNVSYRAAHGWVYAGTVQPGSEHLEPASEGWIPQAVVKRVSLCRVAMDWPAEGSGTLGVARGEVVAVSKEAERGWVYGERIGPRQPDRPADGWLPKKVLDYLQS
jgi:cold shock CspA family protein